MAIQVNINGTTYDIPVQGANPPWGEQVTDVLVALSDAVSSIVGTSDILLTSFTVANNQAVAANVNGASFDPNQVRSAIIQYNIYRSTTLNELSECGHIYLTYKSTAMTWELAQNYAGSSGVVFTITTGGQLQYTSSNMAGSSYSGLMKFAARAFTQT